MGYFRHPAALIESEDIGEGTRVWAFAHILAGARIGRECNICDHVFIENGVVVGDRVTVKCGVQLWEGITIEDDVFIGPNATFTNDPFPRSKQHPEKYAATVVRAGASIGANATVLPGVSIGQGAMIGAGAVVVGNVPANSILVGNPGHIVGYVGASEPAEPLQEPPAETGPLPIRVRGVTLHRLPLVQDLRGWLSFGEAGRHVPFEIRRYFLVFEVASEKIRGEHAHKKLHQFLVCVHGRCHVLVDDGQNRQAVILDQPTLGLHVPPMVWTVQYKHSKDAVLLALASDPYDPEDYIRDYGTFLALAGARK
jgi:acetyltransferase-like isoleucine patch superfamily enzyme/dTDP-4-dehydrorhamnose 3,5-epimerase-like enzyme